MTLAIAFALIASLGLLVESTVGFAGALLAIPLFAMVMSPRDAVPAYALVTLSVNSFSVWEGRHHIEMRPVRRMLLGGLPGVPLGALALKYLPAAWIGTTISVITLAFGLLLLARVRVRFPEHEATEPTIGLLSGLLGGSISSPGPPVVLYAIARRWTKDVFRSSLMAYFLCLAAAGAVCYVAYGMVTQETLVISLAALLPGFAASRLGGRLKRRISERTFRWIVLIIILLVGVSGLLKHLVPPRTPTVRRPPPRSNNAGAMAVSFNMPCPGCSHMNLRT